MATLNPSNSPLDPKVQTALDRSLLWLIQEGDWGEAETILSLGAQLEHLPSKLLTEALKFGGISKILKAPPALLKALLKHGSHFTAELISSLLKDKILPQEEVLEIFKQRAALKKSDPVRKNEPYELLSRFLHQKEKASVHQWMAHFKTGVRTEKYDWRSYYLIQQSIKMAKMENDLQIRELALDLLKKSTLPEEGFLKLIQKKDSAFFLAALDKKENRFLFFNLILHRKLKVQQPSTRSAIQYCVQKGYTFDSLELDRQSHSDLRFEISRSFCEAETSILHQTADCAERLPIKKKMIRL